MSGPETHAVFVNGQRVTTVGTLSTGANGYNPSPAIQGSATVRINGVPVVRNGDLYAPHTNGTSVIQESAAGVSLVFSG